MGSLSMIDESQFDFWLGWVRTQLKRQAHPPGLQSRIIVNCHRHPSGVSTDETSTQRCCVDLLCAATHVIFK